MIEIQDTIYMGTAAPASGGGGSGDAVWGSITGTLSNQTDLQTALNAKVNNSDLSTYVTTNTAQDITATKTFSGGNQEDVIIKEKSSGARPTIVFKDKLNNACGKLQYRGNIINSKGLFFLETDSSVYTGFRYYDSLNSAVYALAAPLASDAKTPFNLTTSQTNFYIPLGVTDGTTMVTTASSGVLDISPLLSGGGGTVDQTYNASSTNAQSGVAIAGAGFLKNQATGSGGLAIGFDTANEISSTLAIGNNATVSNLSTAIAIGNRSSSSGGIAIGNDTHAGAFDVIIGNSVLSSAIPDRVGANPVFAVVDLYNSSDHAGFALVDLTTGKIPNNRINVDANPTQNSTNFVTSGTIYTVLGNINTLLSQI